ncbi:hypothetical protein EHM92_09395 [bacterium]|nr:MAG: hypothetical protein EHM92_09395 [bacterium]
MRNETWRNTIGPLGPAVLCMAIALLGLGVGQSKPQDAAAQAPPPQSAEHLVTGLYGLVSSRGVLPDWNKVRDCFLKEAVIVLRTSRTATTVFSLDGFIQDFVDFYERPFKTPEGTFLPKDKGFSERVLRIRTWEYGDIAHVLVLYEAGILGISRPPQQGVDSFQLARRGGRWFITAIINEVVTPERPVPPELQPAFPAVRK